LCAVSVDIGDRGCAADLIVWMHPSEQSVHEALRETVSNVGVQVRVKIGSGRAEGLDRDDAAAADVGAAKQQVRSAAESAGAPAIRVMRIHKLIFFIRILPSLLLVHPFIG
jgi:hypothetical protein